MGILNSMELRRSYYSINDVLPVSEDTVSAAVLMATELTPDAFNCHSARVAVLFGDKHRELWAGVYSAFGGKLSREKAYSFRAGAGTVLFFYDRETIEGLQERFPAYADNFPLWARDANGMLQLAVWTALRDLGIGASLQHYNPVINPLLWELCDFPESYMPVAQMPFGGIAGEPREKDSEDITKRVKILY